ncbi:hypothetical protein ACI0FW_00596 [Alcaligenes nematophilus]
MVEFQSSMPSSRSTPTAHGVGGGDLELVKGVGMLRLEGARSHHAGHGPVRVGNAPGSRMSSCYLAASPGVQRVGSPPAISQL